MPYFGAPETMTEAATPQLPCRCGAKAQVVQIKTKHQHAPKWFVRCPDCGRQTSPDKDPDRTIATWRGLPAVGDPGDEDQ